MKIKFNRMMMSSVLLKGKHYDRRDFKMRLAATLPELSEWTLLMDLMFCPWGC